MEAPEAPPAEPAAAASEQLPLFLRRGQGPPTITHWNPLGHLEDRLPLRFSEFELASPEKRNRGIPSWRILREKVTPSTSQVRQIRSEISQQLKAAKDKQQLQEVFNPNPHRFQLPLASDHPLVLQLMTALAEDGALHACKMGKAVALYSSAGCEQQPWHVDFDPMCKKRKGEERVCIRDLRDSQKPKGVFWAIEEGSRLMVAGPDGESVEVHLERGDVLIFDGDLVHAGAAYEKSNVRVHVYLYACGAPKPNGNTYKVPGFVPVSKVHVQMGDRAAVI